MTHKYTYTYVHTYVQIHIQNESNISKVITNIYTYIPYMYAHMIYLEKLKVEAKGIIQGISLFIAVSFYVFYQSLIL